MSSSGSLQLTKQAIGTILANLKITHVVYVDDVFERDHDVESVIGWFAEAHGKLPTETQALIPDVSLDKPNEVWNRELRNIWPRLDDTRKTAIVVELSAIRDKHLSEDLEVAGRLQGLFPRKLGPEELSPAAWEQRRDQIVNQASADARVLCLFDQDLSEAPGFTSAGARSGIGLIADLVARGVGNNVVCGLFTHTIDTPGEEMIAWRRLAQENDLGFDTFLPLAKLRANDANPLRFADGIKKAALNVYCEKLKTALEDTLTQAYIEARDRLFEIDVYDFDHMVLQTSRSEGEWEADTLLRIFQIFERDATRRLMLDAARSESFNLTVQAARPISQVDTAAPNDASHPRITGIRKQELYEDAGLVACSPLRVGDLFEAKNGSELTQYVLLAQPCDLAVRADGKRSVDNLIVPLIPIREKLSYQEAATKKLLTYWRTHAAMYYFYEDSNDVAIVAFAEVRWVDVDALDLVVLDVAGSCRLNLRDGISLPPQLTSGWATHIKEVEKKFREHRSRLDGLRSCVDTIVDDDSRTHIWRSVMPRLCLSDAGVGRVSYSDGCLDFGLRRFGRYRRPGADRLLKAYTQYLSRDAEEHDFARPVT